MKYSLDRSLKRRDNIFGEGFVRQSGRPPRMPRVEGPRWLFLMIVLVVFSFWGFARIADLQLVRGSYFRSLSDGNRIRRVPLRAPRGEIVDRNGKPLARNTPVYKLAQFSSGGIVTKTEELSREEALKIQSLGQEASDPSRNLAGLLVDIKREYPLGAAGAHLIGYVSEANPEEIGQMANDKCQMSNNNAQVYILGDLVGRMGIEKQYDCILRGIDGEELIEVDTRGRLVRRLGRRDPVPGKTIKLAIDADLQNDAYNALVSAPALTKSVGGASFEGGEVARGAFVAQNPTNGEILALVSVPSFDPSTIARDYNHLANDKNLPLFNRAVSGAYNPGSTFKIVTSAAGLEDGKIDKDFKYKDEGILTVKTAWGSFSYTNWYFTQYGKTEGEIGIVRALTRSTDTFFYKVGELVGPDRLAFWAQKFGYGAKTGIDLPGEVIGLMPTPDWKIKTKGESWFLGNTYHMAIGQGDVVASPVQVNQMTEIVASGGKLCRPKVVQVGQAGQVDQGCVGVGLEQDTLDAIKEGMIGACSTGGTAFPFFGFSPKMACKTGTAQTIESRTHAWFTAFGPIDEGAGQLIVATAVLEDAGEGSRVAAPVVRQALQGWFSH